MTQSLHNALGKAVQLISRPLAKILIRNGIAYSTFADWVKKVYVDVAFNEFGEAGKKQTVSRVSALTGISRKEVKRLHELNSNIDADNGQRYNRAIRVISGWVNDRQYLDNNGNPKVLQVGGDTCSFTHLVREYSGDIPPRAMLSVLLSAGTVQETDDGQVRLVRHAFIPGNDAIDMLHILGTDIAELVATIDYNLTTSPDDLFFQRKVSNVAVNPEAIPAFRELSAIKAQALLEELDAWLEQHKIEPDGEETVNGGQYVSLGIFYSEHNGSQEN